MKNRELNVVKRGKLMMLEEVQLPDEVHKKNL